MAEPFLGEIKLVGFNFAPLGWAMCNGQLLSIAQNTALFSLLGTMYGGDGQTTFALPDFRSRIPIHFNNTYPQGTLGGTETVTLTTNQIPTHTHPLQAIKGAASSKSPSNNVLANTGATPVYAQPGNPVSMAAAVQPVGSTQPHNNIQPYLCLTFIMPVGSTQPHNNIQPYLCLTFIIALEGVFPSQN